MGERKRFSKRLYNQNDSQAKDICKEFWANREIELRDNPNRYGPDLLMFKDNEQIGMVECEIKRVWKGKDFPWPTIQFPERKAKYIDAADGKIIFFMLNNECTHAVIVEGNDLITSEKKEVSNIYVRKGEYFYQVPVEKAVLVEI